MQVMKQMWSSGLVVGLLFTALVIGGCAKGDKADISTSVDSPSAATFRPIGTIQGKIRDAVTLQPIVNAVVSIGLAIDVTDAYGQYILANVPATSDGLNGTVTGNYDITVDLRAVVLPIDMRVAATSPRYPDFSYKDVSVEFTSLDDTACGDDNQGSISDCTNSTNHDTAVDGLVTNADVNVGKLAANIQGVVAGCSVANGDFFTPVGAGYTVNLINNVLSPENSGSGASGRVVATTTTDANGAFTFNNIEANRSFVIKAMDSATAPTREGTTSPFTSPTDGQTYFLRIQESTAVHVCLVDSHAPEIVSVSPEVNSDQTAGATTVTLTFSEPIKQEAASSTVPSTVGSNLYDNIRVNFDGNKAGNIPYTLAWNATFTQLTVSFTTGASALYNVMLPDVGTLRDADLNPAVPGACPIDSIAPWVNVEGAGTDDDCVVYFSTNGGPTPGTTTALTLTNAASLDQGTGVFTGLLDWPVISGSKKYNLYCQTLQVYQDGTSQVDSDFVRVVTGALSSGTSFNFVTFVGSGNEHSQKYDCKVRGVNSDGAEGADSNVVRAEDKIGPLLTAQAPTTFVFDNDGDGNADTVRVTFNEPLNAASAQTPGNYVFAVNAGTVPTTTAAVVCTGTAGVPVTSCPAGNSVVLTISQTQTVAALTDNAGDTLTVSGVKDLNLNTIRTAGDVMNLLTGAVN